MKFTFTLLLTTLFYVAFAQNSTQNIADSLEQVRTQEFLKIADPKTGEIPFGELEKARQEISNKLATKQPKTAISPTLTWYERGPKDISAETRCISRDPNDATGKKYWVGTLNGGLWYNNDITNANSAWNQVTGGDGWASLNISSIVFNPANSQEMYVATGDFFSNAGATGGGIYKSTNGGNTFTRLSSTIPNSAIIGTEGYAFRYANKLAMNTAGHLFANTWNGLLKSTDGGETWTFLLNGQVGSDIEIGNDGIIYAAFGNATNSSKIYRSNDGSGTSWTDISPLNTGGRTEIALANSTNLASQVMYAFAVSGSVTWFKKSIDGGNNWTTINIPQLPSSSIDFVNYTSFSISMIVHPSNPNVVIAAGNYLTKSIDGGITWFTTNSNYSGTNNLVIGNGGASLAFCTGFSVQYSPDFGNQLTTTINSDRRNVGLRTQRGSSVSLNNIRENGRIVGSGYAVNSSLHTLGSSVGGIGYYPDLVFIDQDNPNVVVSGAYLYNANLNNIFTLSNYYIYAYDYDSPNNIFYSFLGGNATSTNIERVVDVGNTNTKSSFIVNTQINAGTFLKAGKTANTIFVGASLGKLYKISNIDTTPIVTQIDNNLLPSATISSIDIGETDNEILVTFSNYSISSVWYTTDGGSTWINKDDVGHGLPNIPVYHARLIRFTPTDAPKVVLATELGVFSTNNIQDTNPAWESSSTGLPNIRCNWIYYRSADSVLAVATNGRGMFTSPMRGFVNPSINNDFNKGVLCKSGSANIPFSTFGAFPQGTVFRAEISNSSVSFASPTVIGSGTSSPISVTLPSNLTSSSNYKIRVVSVETTPKVSNESPTFSVRSTSEISFSTTNYNNVSTINGAYNFCEGSNISVVFFTSSAGNTSLLPYSWTGPNGFTSNSQTLTINNASASAVGTYTVSSAIESCQTYTSTVQLALTTTPSVNSYANPTTICPNTTFSLSVYPKVFPSGNVSYQWSGPNNFSSTVQNPTIPNASVNATGVYTVTSTFSGSCNSTITSTASLTVSNNLPISTSSSGQTCSGGTITLVTSINASTSGMTLSYAWSGPNSFTSSLQNPTISNLSSTNAGIYTATVTYSGSCAGTSTSTVMVSLGNVFVSYSGSTQYCSGATTNLSASVTVSGLSTQYSWAGPNGFTSTGNVLAISNFTSTNAGIYTVTASYTGACNGTSTTQIPLSVLIPTAFSSAGNQYCQGTSGSVSASYNLSPISYSWAGPNGFSSTVASPTISNIDASKAGTYTVTAIFGNGCNATSTATTAIILTNNIPTHYITQSNAGGEYCMNAGSVGLGVSSGINFSSNNINTVAWVGPNGFSSNSVNPTVSTSNINNSGIYTATISFIGCVGTATATTKVNISTLPKVTGFVYGNAVTGIANPSIQIYQTLDVCAGNNFILEARSNGQTASQSWTGPNSFSSSAFINVFGSTNASMAGVYTVTTTLTGTCAGTATSTVQINFINSTPPDISVTPENFVVGQPVTLSAANCAGTLKWNYNSTTSNPLVLTPTDGQSIFATCTTNGCITANSRRITFNNCASSYQLGANLTNLITRYEASNTINATNKIIPISNITYDAQNSVVLNPGFEVQAGSVFKAQIDGCGNN